MLEIKGKYTTAKIMIDDVEETALTQIYNMVNNLAFTEPVVIQPDTHAGAGCVIGFTMSISDKIVPSVVGVDLGCGMLSVNIGNDLPTGVDKIDIAIRKVIPMGNLIHDTAPDKYFKKNFNWELANETLRKFLMKYNAKFGTNYKPIEYSYDWFITKCKDIKMKQNAELGIGSLGGGNHFIEICKSENSNIYWLTIHSGSRNFGKCICEYHQNIARSVLENKRKVLLNAKINELKNDPNIDRSTIAKQIEDYKKFLGINYDTKSKGLEYLEGQDAINYFIDMIFAQMYADLNRRRMIELIIEKLNLIVQDEIHTVHNYINFDDLIIRKGAIRSYEGERMIIPLNMRDGILICEGKSNPDWNYSAPHGAGRLRSRGDASRNLDLAEFKRSMKNVYSTSVCKETLDESPQAYKRSDVIMEAIEPTAVILDVVKPVLNIKDKGEKISWKEMRQKAKSENYSREEKRKNIKKERADARRLKNLY